MAQRYRVVCVDASPDAAHATPSSVPASGRRFEDLLLLGAGAPPSGRFQDLFLLGGGTEVLPWLTVAQEGRVLAVVGPRLDTSDVSRVTHDYVLRWAGQVRWHDTRARQVGLLTRHPLRLPVSVRRVCCRVPTAQALKTLHRAYMLPFVGSELVPVTVSRDGRWLYVVYSHESRALIATPSQHALVVVSRQTGRVEATLDLVELQQPQGIAVLANNFVVVSTLCNVYLIDPAGPCLVTKWNRIPLNTISVPDALSTHEHLGAIAAASTSILTAVCVRGAGTGYIALVEGAACLGAAMDLRRLGDSDDGRLDGSPVAVAFANQDAYLLVAAVSPPSVTMWRVATGVRLRQLVDAPGLLLQQPRMLVAGAGTTVLIVDTLAGNRKCIHMFDWQTGVFVRTLHDSRTVVHHSAIRGIALTPLTGILIVLDCCETRAFQQRASERVAALEIARRAISTAHARWLATLGKRVDLVARLRQQAIRDESISGLDPEHGHRQATRRDQARMLKLGWVDDSPAERAIWVRQDARFDAAMAAREEWAMKEMYRFAYLDEGHQDRPEAELHRRADASSSEQDLADAQQTRNAEAEARACFAEAEWSSHQLGGGDNSARAVRIREYV